MKKLIRREKEKEDHLLSKNKDGNFLRVGEKERR